MKLRTLVNNLELRLGLISCMFGAVWVVLSMIMNNMALLVGGVILLVLGCMALLSVYRDRAIQQMVAERQRQREPQPVPQRPFIVHDKHGDIDF